jgi:class 3 adenylate cyclase
MTGKALLFTDLVRSTNLVERLGDVRSSQLWTEHDRRACDLRAQHCGREIDRTDGFFLLFDDVTEPPTTLLATKTSNSDCKQASASISVRSAFG